MLKNDSLFHPEYLPQLEEITIYKNDFHLVFTIVFCLSLFFLTLLFATYRNKAPLLFSALFSQPIFSQLLRDGKLVNERIYIYILSFIIPTQALLFFSILSSFFPNIFNILLPHQLFLLLFIGVLFFHFLNIAINRFIFDLLNWNDISSRYYLNKLFFSYCLCIAHLVILPLVIFSNLNFAYYLYIPILVFLSISLIIRILKLNSTKTNQFHFFVYFCTLEILPYLVTIKFLIIWENRF